MFKTLNLKKLILSFLIPFGVAFLSEILTKNAMEEYANLASPPLSPPGVVFPIVWAVLYFLMSLSPVSYTHLDVYKRQIYYRYIGRICSYELIP